MEPASVNTGMIQRMAALFDTLTASDALEAAGMDRQLARACAAQIHAAASTGEAVTRPELEAALTALKAELLDRIAESERGLLERIAESERGLLERAAESERGLVDRITETERGLVDRIAETERRLTVLLWRLFGGLVGLAGLVVAALKLLP